LLSPAAPSSTAGPKGGCHCASHGIARQNTVPAERLRQVRERIVSRVRVYTLGEA
jgi:hypothetical protein